jgi:polyisoprenoid-binding protein YceI
MPRPNAFQRRRKIRSICVLLVLAILGRPVRAQSFTIDTERSSLIVRVYPTGLFSVFAHDHEIRAPISHGSITLSPRPGVEFTVPTAKMVVLDPKLGRDKRAEVQMTMLGPKVLDVERYPEIRFRSLRAQSSSPGKWVVEGELSIRDRTRPVQVMAMEGNDGNYRGAVTIRQKDYGIQPISLAGGTVKVKDAIRIEFEIARRQEPPPPAANPFASLPRR